MQNKNSTYDFDISFKSNKKEYFLTYLSVALLNPTFAQYNIFHILFTIIAFYYFKKSGLKFDKLFVGIVILLNFVAISQAFVLGEFTATSYFGIYLIFLMPYFIIRIIGNNYWKYYINIMYFFAIIALAFWSLQNFSNQFTDILINISETLKLDPISNESIIIYNLEHRRVTDIWGLIKNGGFLAEGGVYSCLLILALFFNTIFTKRIFEKKNLIFIISLLSTNSTAGYAALGIYLVGSSYFLRHLGYKFILLPASLALFYIAIFQLPFLYDKVSSYYISEMNTYQTQVTASRMGRFLSARIDLDLIAQNPLWGRGIHKETRYLTKLEEDIGYSNSYLGLVGFASRYGLIIWLIYFYLLFKSLSAIVNIYQIRKYYTFIILASIAAVAFGQNPFTNPPYLILVYLGFYLRK
jgi:hypothetical protein